MSVVGPAKPAVVRQNPARNSPSNGVVRWEFYKKMLLTKWASHQMAPLT